MKIVHICLACFYVENMGYQENILPRLHAQMGHTVYVLTSDYQFDAQGHPGKKQEREYTNADGVQVKVLERCGGLPGRLGKYSGLTDHLARLEPDILFVHGGQFLSLSEVTDYCRRHSQVRLYIDQHGDYYNMPVKTWKQKLIQTQIYGRRMRRAANYCRVFWGVTPWRCQYLQQVYGLPARQVALLPMGGLEGETPPETRREIRSQVRRRLGLSEQDFVLVTGGKIDAAKKITPLMRAVAELNRESIKLVVFGVPSEQMREEFERDSADAHIRCVGWIASEDVSQYLFAADLAVFPGTHSVLWEQACAAALPCIFGDWPEMHHVDVGGNCIFVKDGSVDELKEKILAVSDDPEKYRAMKTAAAERAAQVFSYREIAKRAIEL